MAIQNIYYERKVGTARPCYVCRRPTTTVLATIKTEDFLYTCEGHLTDPGFASELAAPPPGPSADEVRKIVDEYRAREARRTAAKESKDKEGEKKEEKGGGLLSYLPSIPGLGSKEEDKKDGSKSPSSPTPISPVNVPSSPAPPSHRKFELHRAIYANRRAELARKEQTARAKEVSKVMPQAPRGAF